MNTEALARIDAAIARHESQNAGDPFHFDLTNHLYVALVEARALIPEPPTDDEREALADHLGAQLFARNVRDYTDETTTVIEATVEDVVDAVLVSAPWRNRGRGPITDDGASHTNTEYALEVGHTDDTEGVYVAETFDEMATPGELLPYVPGARLVKREWSVTDWVPVPADELDDDEAARDAEVGR
ncbi:hypothetical protein [Microbacterium thalli]|uniref:hypothetical protein n=1 Tax=Microbacterium thalli TaxID=3027921 RepID=UPI002366C9B1|nr:hypothetical protein [Microbacterium thalli]MDD7930101.1 hypothetical protein [Microbacterium thalli]